ncbi:CAP domain-containing protein [Patescibacteria group bacterium]|nr:CAP domain-containing protein [Patescibacteria group bacterium]MBU1890821.1 CAP domain-containing protein [Patescibacteria group bacterium]
MLTAKNFYLGIGTKLMVLVVGIICLLFLLPTHVSAEVIHPTQDIVYLTNQERINNDLLPLSLNSKLIEAANKKAQDMLTKNYFNHNSPDGHEPWDFITDADYPYIYAGENLAINYPDSLSTFKGWLNSPSHYENIVFPSFQEIGVAIHSAEINGQVTTVTVQLFGSRNDFTPFNTFLSDATTQPKVSESIIDQTSLDREGKSGYVASSVTTSLQRPPVDSNSSSHILIWAILITYLAIIIGLLFYLTQKQFFYIFIKKIAIMFWVIFIVVILT